MIVYRITNAANGKAYIGITRHSLARRWKNHMAASKRSETPLYRAMRKHGIEHFTIEVLEEHADYDSLRAAEIRLIECHQTFDLGYNATRGGDGALGRVPSVATRAAMRAASTEAMSDPKRREAVSIAAKKLWAEKREAMLLSFKSRPPVTAETRRKLSIAGRSRPPRSAEYRAKISEALTGKKRPAEVMEKVAAFNRGRKFGSEFGAAVSKRLKGVPKTPEHRAAMREAWVRRRQRSAAVAEVSA